MTDFEAISSRGADSQPRLLHSIVPIPVDHRRPDIDGLRAVAVLSVLAYHAFPTLVTGGFVGVDVFFVISGYLISGIILENLRTGNFTLRNFYAHRIRRIFPSLMLVLGATAVAGYWQLYPDEWQELGREIVAGSLFFANFLFWREAGYFDVASELKPLLHLWSLSIEEQFYLFWPAFLFLFRGRRKSGLLILGMLAISLVGSLLVRFVDQTADFYSPGTRFWELGAGALLAWYELGGQFGILVRHRQSLSIAGFFLIAGSVVWIDRTMLFPGAIALLPIVGAVALIAAGKDAYVNQRILSHPIAVSIGLVSYPLYLWHWPLLSFSRIVLGEEPSAACRVALLLIGLALSVATYRLVEIPIRLRVPLGSVVRLSVLALPCLAVAAWLTTDPGLYTSQFADLRGSISQLGNENQRLLTWFDHDTKCISTFGLEEDAAIAKTALFCTMSEGSGPISVIIFGDSMANSLFPGLAKLYAGRNQRVLNVGNGTCAPFRGLAGHFDWNRPCANVNNKVYAYILGHPEIHTVILAMAPWDIANMDISGTDGKSSVAARFAAIQPLVTRDINELKQAGKRVIVTFDTPRIGYDPKVCLRDLRRCIVPRSTVERGMEPYRGLWHNIFTQLPYVCEFAQDPLFRLPDGNYATLRDGHLLFRDDHHLSYLGSDVAAVGLGASACK